ncbi:FmdB family zinc ribbon protein [Cupriavidus consociatus]|uniref:FmdB family zinc ribbon protein n=1 Tax=Cupriavidus consociatus TaxID=2821357 RepID=UPI001AE92764|nr:MULTISPECIES: zinc ribbon domain-containing protein [unclassified Cupriavidus]MBP0625385.1 zinc ribbon domain-containing protein [Cupriavidus sp. LEh25]MDK2662127.1 zinc ribbon domain-containing protein [Cupriavidus sp. LEh21]
MPLYDYVCSDCKSRFEALVRGATTPTCPHCGSNALNKQVSAPSPPERRKAIIAAARRRAAREGHFSNYSPRDVE